MSKSVSFRLQLCSVMDNIAKTAIEQICQIVDSDFAFVRQELSQLIFENAALKDQMHSLRNDRREERNRVRNKASKTRSVCVQTEEEEDGEEPSITAIFGKEWCSSLWGRRHGSRRDETAIDVDLYSLSSNQVDDIPLNLVIVKEENIEVDINSSCTGKPQHSREPQASSGCDPSNPGKKDYVLGEFSEISEIKTMSSNAADKRLMEANVEELIAPVDDALEVDGHCILGQFLVEHNGPNLLNGEAGNVYTDAVPGCGRKKQSFSDAKKNLKYSCEVCGKCFHSNTNLLIHYAVHTGERPYKCSFCGKGFSQKGNVQAHERIHRGERPFSCATCGRSFRQKICLLNHEHIHRGEKPFACGICGKGFNQKSTLQQHLPIHERTAESAPRRGRKNNRLNNSLK
ncbi:hypothetical protein DNTS_015086 [Danionella cerebrum]|uniref:C2H2-type domain-containing protein n=1 Tax=Danionella cerebrum TaxID=2873325 RepID=A0A553QQA2_9TELE|nr:hypothetical protein DNTS_015086 [Danionella translucida]